jgi:hypothetical protein
MPQWARSAMIEEALTKEELMNGLRQTGKSAR